MRLYADSSAAETLDRLLVDPAITASVVAHRVLPARPAETRPFPDWLHERLRAGLRARGFGDLYRHQAEAIDALHAGSDVIVVTPTASGKSLCYNLPVLQSVAEDPSARALYLFPTKALSQDQTAELRDLAAAARLELAAAVYDGDTPAPVRSSIRAAGQVVVTNPDMLHAAILPHHEVVPAVRAVALHRHRRGAHLPRRLRQPCRERHQAAAPHLRPLRKLTPDRLLLRDDREPAPARGDAHGTALRRRRP